MTYHKGKHILIIRLSALGDVAMTIPAIYSLARTYPDMKITVATRAFFGRLFVNRPANVAVIPVDTTGRHAGIKGLWRLIGELKQLRPDMVADFHDSLRSRTIDIAMRSAGIPVAMIDKDRRNRRRLTHRGSNAPVQQTPYTERYINVLRQLGLNPEQDFSGLFTIPKKSGCIGIAPFARYSTKTYPPELMEKVAAHFADNGLKVYLFGSKGSEADMLRQWETAHPGCIAMPGRLSIEQELELMASLPLMVTMDSANMHMASLAGTPVISVWGSTTPHCGFMGYGQSPDNAIVLGLACQPCSIAGKPECPRSHFNCMRMISPDTIINRIEAALQ